MWSIAAASARRLLCHTVLLVKASKISAHLSAGLLIFFIAFASLICVAILQFAESQFNSQFRNRFHHLYQAIDDKQRLINTTKYVNYSDKRPSQPSAQRNDTSFKATFQFLGKLADSTKTIHSFKFPSEDSSFSYRLTSAEWSSLQDGRRALMRQVCSELNRNTDIIRVCGLRLDGIFIDKYHHVLYCAIPKVATSSVKLALAFMTGKINRTNGDTSYPVHINGWLRSIGIYSVDYLVENDSTWLKSAWSSLRKFVVVRHPLERLVSAYVDKFTLHNKFTEYFQRRFGRRIVHLYRNTSGQRSKTGEKFGHDKDEPGRDVTFSEFVRFLIDEKIPCAQKSNPHWMSFLDMCHPCFVDYDYIIHYEGLSNEMWHLWKAIYNKTNVDDVLLKRNAGYKKSSDLVSGYLSELAADHVSYLYNIYRHDFRMFAYK